jgi:hypothetical protein
VSGTVTVDEVAARRALDTLALRAHLERLGEAGVACGRSIAPDAPVLRKGYIAGFFWRVNTDAAGRPVLTIANKNWKTIWIERGTAPHATHPHGRTGTGPVTSSPAHHIFERILDYLRTI